MDPCPICLDPCPRTLQCVNHHPIHGRCLLAMIQHMGKNTCPYCAAAIRIPLPSAHARAAVTAEHALYALALAPLLLQERNRSLWIVNSQMLELRLRCEFVPPVVESILNSFRRRMGLVAFLIAAIIAVAAWRSSGVLLVCLLAC